MAKLVYLKEGSEIFDGRHNVVKISESDSKLMWTVTKNYNGDWTLLFDNNTTYYFKDVKNIIDEVKLLPVPTDFKKPLTIGTVIEFKNDWSFNGYNSVLLPDFDSKRRITHKIDKGSQFTIAKNTCIQHSFFMTELTLVLEQDDRLNMFSIWDKEYSYLPLKGAYPHIEIVQNGNDKFYWKIENETGKELVSKKFLSKNAALSSIRVRCGHGSKSEINEASEMLNLSNGLNLVKYNYETDNKIDSEDVMIYAFEHTMKGKTDCFDS